jgi:DNA-binding MarR family transcriptional regulator
MTDVDWELYSWIIRGNQRRKVLKVLGKPRIPTEIKSEAKMSITNVSKVLRDFERKGLVKCLTPQNKTGKLYSLTDAGRAMRDEMLKK